MLNWISKHVFFPLWEIKDGAHRRQYLRELRASQWLDTAELRRLQWDRLREAVAYAFQHCAYYKEQWGKSGFDGTLRDLEQFRRLPLLSKLQIRENSAGLISDEHSRESLVESRTGGSTGVALTLYFDERCQELRNAAAMRSDQWAGWDIGMKIAAIWGNPPIAKTLKEKLRNLLLDRTFYLDTMDINRESVTRFVGEWRRERPGMIFGHSHSIYILARHLDEMGISDLRPRGIISTSMMLLEPERAVIERTFGCKVTNRYGCEEVGLISCECERHDGMHLNLDHVLVEFLRDDGTEAAPGEEGNIVLTDLINRGMPLVRYRVGDVGVTNNRLCACGRGSPLMERVTGRQADFLKRADGSMVAGVSLVERTLTAIAGIEQMQLVQDVLDKVTVKVVRGPGYDEQCESMLRDEFQSVFGEKTTIEIRHVAALDQTRAGKYRFSICNV